MKQGSQYKSILLLGFMLSSFSIYGQVYRKNKTITKSFGIEQNTELNLTNKYGRVQLINWDKDSVKFEISMEVHNKKEAKAIAIVEDVHIDFMSSKHYLESKTSFVGEGNFWSGVKGKTGNVFSSDSKISIDYKVYLPAKMAITIENKYGDVILDDHLGNITITLSNGDLKAHYLGGNTILNLEFAYANIKNMESGQLNLGYHSELQLGIANELRMNSKSSRVKIDKAAKLDIKSHRDKYSVKEVGLFKATNSYTYLEIGSLREQLSIKAKYGDIDIKLIENEVVSLNFEVENTDITLIEPINRPIEFELIYNMKAGLYFPKNLLNKELTLESEKEKLVKTTGTLGSSTTKPVKVKAKLISANIRVNEN